MPSAKLSKKASDVSSSSQDTASQRMLTQLTKRAENFPDIIQYLIRWNVSIQPGLFEYQLRKQNSIIDRVVTYKEVDLAAANNAHKSSNSAYKLAGSRESCKFVFEEILSRCT